MKTTFLSFLGLFLLTAACTQQISIVPEPVKQIALPGHYTLDVNTKLVFLYLAENETFPQYAQAYFQKYFGIALNAYSEQAPNWDSIQNMDAIVFKKNTTRDSTIGDEGYKIVVSEKAVLVEANTEAGLLYSLQTLYQLAPADVAKKKPAKISIPSVMIVDYPRFEWRGSHLDVSRHFFDTDYIKKHLDVMTLYKLNKFHWHLTDDHGWRVEIDKYPKLMEIGAWRVDRSDVPWTEGEPPKEGEPATYGGYYTKDQVKEILQYAAQRNIEVIPEIEIPGHCSEILAAYPEFACDTFPYYVQIGPYWPPKAIMCGGNDDVIRFFKDVLDEIAELFPSEYIHIGGDEAEKGNWKTCAKCQKRIKKHKLANEEELQGWMIREVEKHVRKHGKRIIGWDEILEGGVSPDATIMYWRGWVGDSVLIKAASQGNEIIMTPNNYCYLDYYQADETTEPKAMSGYLPMELVYAFDPVLESLPSEAAPFIKGGQANLWTEFLFTSKNVEYMLLPRLLALSESVWTPKENKNWKHFLDRLPEQKKRLAALNYNYCNKIGWIRKPKAEPQPAPADESPVPADTAEATTPPDSTEATTPPDSTGQGN
jgi:hexosaminidase